MLVFSHEGTPVEDVEKVCDVVKLFIETGQVAANKDLRIPLNKKLRNAELKQFVTNIIRYNIFYIHIIGITIMLAKSFSNSFIK